MLRDSLEFFCKVASSRDGLALGNGVPYCSVIGDPAVIVVTTHVEAEQTLKGLVSTSELLLLPGSSNQAIPV